MDKLISQQAAIEAVEFGITYAKAIDTETGEVRELFKQSNEELRKAVERIKQLPPAEPESISKWKKDFREYVDSLDIARDDWKGIIEYIDELPSAEQNTTTHDSIPAETGKNDGDRTSGDCISRQMAIEAVEKSMYENPHENAILRGMHDHEHRHFLTILMGLPSAQPEPAIPLSWIEGQIKWLKSMDNAFATLSAEQISALVNKWKDEQDG